MSVHLHLTPSPETSPLVKLRGMFFYVNRGFAKNYPD